MTRAFAAGLAEVASALTEKAGSFLDGIVREQGTTCVVCSGPVDGEVMCFQCHKLTHAGVPTADRVASLVYAVEPDSQTYHVVRDYKGQRPVPSHQEDMSALLALGLRGHAQCAAVLGDSRIAGWTVVPSTQGQTTLRNLLLPLARHPEQEVTVVYTGPERHREFSPDLWAVDPGKVHGHVLVIDDSWVSGVHSQSVAASLKAAGAQQVSIFTVARVLNPEWGPTKPFIRGRLRGGSYDWT